MVVPDNVDNNVSVKATNSGIAFDKHSDLLDETITNLYNDELYQDNLLDDGFYYNHYYDVNGETVFQNFKNLFISNSDRQKKLIDVVKTQSDNISNTYNYSVDMHRNQNTMNRFVENKVNKFRNRNKSLLEKLDGELKMNELQTYYYKKRRSQIKILYSIVIACIIGIVLKFANKNIKTIMPDSLFILSLALLFVLFLGNLFIQIIDIIFRHNINFDEYDFHYNREYDGKSETTSETTSETSKSDDDKCAVQIENYKKKQVVD